MHRLILALVAIMALALAACSSPGSSPSSSEASAAPSTEASEEASASEEPSASEDASSSEIALPSIDLPDSAPELAALLPTQVGDIEIPEETRISMNGADFMAMGTADPVMDEFLSSVGAEPDDISVAFAGGASDDGASTVGFFAFRVAGADSDDLLREFRAASEADSDTPVDWEETSVGGKDVIASSALAEDMDGGNAYLYVREDIIFMVSATSEELAADALSQLP